MGEVETNKADVQELYETYADDVYRYALYMLAEEQGAEDVVQEVFVRAYLGWDKFRHESSVRTWILKITRNYIYDLLRKRRTERRYKSLLQTEVSYEDTRLEDVETYDLLQQLPEKYRDILLLRSMAGFTAKEVGIALGISKTHVNVLHHRAKKRLHELLIESDMRSMRKGGNVHEVPRS